MRILIIIAAFLVGLTATAQEQVVRAKKVIAESDLLVPQGDTSTPGLRAGDLRLWTANNTLYLWNGTKWQASAFDVSNLIPNRPKMRLVATVIQPTVVGSVVTWNFIINSLHDSVFVNTVTSDGSYINVKYNATAGKIISSAVTPDEVLTNAGVTCGASVGADSMRIQIFRNRGSRGGLLTGNGTSSWTATNNTLYSYVYSTATGFLTIQPNSLPSYGSYSWSGDYVGINGYKLWRMSSGFGGLSGGWALRDFFGNAVTTNPQSTDLIQINTGDQYIESVNPSVAAGDGWAAAVFSTFSNIWIIALIELP